MWHVGAFISRFEPKVGYLEILEMGQSLEPHMSFGAVDVPIEETGADVTHWTRNVPANRASWKIILVFLKFDCVIATFFQISSGLIPIA